MGAADLLRCDQPLIGMGWRHPDIDDRYVGLLGGHDLHELAPVTSRAGDLDTGLLEKAGGPLPDQHRVVGDHDPHGISARIMTAPAGAYSTRSRPPIAPIRSATSVSAASSGSPGPAAASAVIRMTSMSASCFASTVAPCVPARAPMSSLASTTRKYPAASTWGGSRSCGRLAIMSGTRLVQASASTAAASPSSASSAG